MTDWWMHQSCGFVTAREIAAGAVTTSAITAQSITSEKASTNLLTRQFSATGPSSTVTSTGFCLWQPSVGVRITSVIAHPLGANGFTTCGDQLILWSSGAGGVLATFTATSTGVANVAGTPIAFTLASTGAQIAAGARICWAKGINVCSTTKDHIVQFDYTTTG